jgi:hypothetical protein
MDDVQKSRIRMAHWIDHNIDQVQGYKEVADILDKAGHSRAAENIRKGIGLIESANHEFESAMTELAPEGEHAHGNDEGAHAHAHSHEHTHGHSHEHPHEHAHEHPHEHSHDHAHGHHHHSGHSHSHKDE